MSNGVDVGLFLRIDGFMDQIKRVPGLTDKELGKIEKALDSVNKMPKRTAKAVDDAGKAMEKTIRSVGDATDSAKKRFDEFNKGSKVIFGPMIDDVMDLKGGFTAMAESLGLSGSSAVIAGTAITGVGVAAAGALVGVAALTTGVIVGIEALESATAKSLELSKEFESLNDAGASLTLLSPAAIDSLERAKLGFEALKIPFQELLVIAMDKLAPTIEDVARLTLGLALQIEDFLRPIAERIGKIARVISMVLTLIFDAYTFIPRLGKNISETGSIVDGFSKTLDDTGDSLKRLKDASVTDLFGDLVSPENMREADRLIDSLGRMRASAKSTKNELKGIDLGESILTPTFQFAPFKLPDQSAIVDSLDLAAPVARMNEELARSVGLWEQISNTAKTYSGSVMQSISDLGQIQGNLSSILGSRISELEAMKSNQNMSKQEIWLIDQKIAKNRAATEILFRAQQALSIANIAMLTAENIAKYAGNPFLMATAAAVGATSAAAVIAQSPPKYHSGMIPGEYPAVLTKGEAVLSRTGVAALGPDTVARANRGQSVSEGGSFFLALNNRVLDTLVSGAIRGGASTRLEIRKKSDTMLLMRRGIYA